MRVALVHDWLTGNRGGEKVLLQLAGLFPEAPVFTLFRFPGRVPEAIDGRDVRTTFLQRLVSPAREYRRLLPLFPLGAESWDLSGFDLVVSSSHCVAKNARRGRGAFHLCYCHTPVRYLHDQFEAYFEGRPGLLKAAARVVRAPLAGWDRATARRVDAFVANSENVRGRIARVYGREADVVPPPVDVDFYTPSPEPRERKGFLIVSALVPYKRIPDALEASRRGGFRLTLAGTGPEEERTRRLAGETVTLAGTPSDEGLRELYRSAEAVLMPGEEDFGIVPVEAQACGTPVIALGRGGALETVVDGVTGVLYGAPGPDPLLAAIDRFRTLRFNPADPVRHARRFSPAAFRNGFLAALEKALRSSGRGDLWERLAADRPAGGADDERAGRSPAT